MSARAWLPSEWLDEIVPKMEASPDAYIHREGDGWCLRLPEGNPSRSDDGEEDCWHSRMEPGQVVSFCWMEDFGHFTLSVNDDRTWSVDRPVPEIAYFWLIYDTDTLADSIDIMVEPIEPGDHTMGAYYWSDATSFRFEVDGDNARFVQCAGASR